MKEYLFEMHAHNAEVSRCAKAFAQELAERYIALGYDGIVSTNHLNSHTFSSPEFKNASWKAKAEKFMSGFRAVEKAVNGRLTVLLGVEVSLYSEPNDYLVYGVTEEFLKNNGDIMSLTKEELSALVHKNGMLIVQAHPFRRPSFPRLPLRLSRPSTRPLRRRRPFPRKRPSRRLSRPFPRRRPTSRKNRWAPARLLRSCSAASSASR